MTLAESPYPFDSSFQAVVDGSGEAEVSFDSGGIINWRVTQVSIEMPTAPVGAACYLRKRGKLVTPMIATGDVAAGDPPIFLKPGETMTVTWTGCTPGDVGTVLVIYDKVGFRR